MQSCHSPVNSVPGVSSGVSTSPKKSAIAISLNGLFGDTCGYDDNITTSLTSQSPIYRNYASGKIDVASPSKALSVELNYNQQPVLLSELADNSFNAGNSGSLIQGNSLCSFISSYDNSRCTNLAVSKSDFKKSFCRNHMSLTELNDTKLHVNNVNPPSILAVNQSTNRRKLSPLKQKMFSPKVKSEQQAGAPKFTDSSFIQAGKIESAHTNGNIDVIDIPSLVSNSQPVVHVSSHQCVNSTSHFSDFKKSNLVTLQNTRNLFRAVPMVAAKNCAGKATSLPVKQSNVKPNNTIVPMDRDVLQAFVDFLNQNHDRLTPKQQLSLLSSLGVAVATVKNPEDFSGSVVTGSPMYKSRQLSSHNSKTPCPSANGPNLNISTNKRKMTSGKGNSVSAKRSKKSDFSTEFPSLKQLSTQDIEDQLSVFDEHFPNKSQSKLRSSNSTWKNDYCPPVPTVSLHMHQNKNSFLLQKAFASKPLKDYIVSEVDKEMQVQNLFSLGPFCDDNDFAVCSCLSANVNPVVSKSRQKSQKQVKARQKPCIGCTKIKTEHPTFSFYNLVLSLSKKQELVTTSSNRVVLSQDIPTTNEDAETPSDKYVSTCRYLRKGVKTWKRLRNRECQSVKMLAEAAQSDLNETARILKQMSPKKRICCQKNTKSLSRPTKCVLTDRTGYQCPAYPLPFASYCRDHIMHSKHQQFYKLDSNMNVIADIYPDPPVIKPRKKPKLPPLSKRKKRRVKKRSMAKLAGAASDEPSEVGTNPQKLFPNRTLHLKHKGLLSSHMQPAISDYVIDTNDDVLASSNSVKMPSVIEDTPLTDNLTAAIDEESNSTIFEAFSFDGEELLHDVTPDMFSELGLDNAFLLNGAVDSIDKLSFGELSDDPYSSTANESCDKTDNPQKTDAEEIKSSSQSSVKSYSATEDSDAFSAIKQSNLQSCPTLPTQNDQLKWPTSEIINEKNTPSSARYDDASSSLDSSFAEDLNELEGVIQSLEDEGVQPTSSDPRKNWSVIDFKNSLQETAMDVEKRSLLSANSSSSQNSIASTESSYIVESSFASGNSYITLPSTDLTCQSTKSHCTSAIPDKTTTCKRPDDVKPTLCLKFPKRTKAKSKKNVLTTTLNTCLPSSSVITSPTNGLQYSTLTNAVSTPTTYLHATMQSQGLSDKSKSKKSKPTLGSQNQTSNPRNVAAINTTMRVQPRLLCAGLSPGTNGKTVNQSMILIPVVRSANQVGVANSNQNLGIAVAIPAQNFGNNMVIPISPTMLTTTNNSQQVLILNSTPNNNVSSNVGVKQTVYQTATASLSQQAATNSGSIFHSSNTVQPAVSHPTQTCVIQNCTPITVQTTPTPANPIVSQQSGGQVFKKMFNRNSIVIPPAPTDTSTNKLNESLKTVATAVMSTSAVSTKYFHTTPISETASSTIHWNQTVATPPPQRKPTAGVGGQTSNMLYCRRINPSLNNNQHVIVGRLGSLGRVGIPRLTVTDRGNKKQNLGPKSAKSEAPMTPDVPSPTVTPWRGKDFIPLSSDLAKSVESRNRKGSCSNHTASQPSSIGTPPPNSSRLRDLSNQHITSSDIYSKDVSICSPCSQVFKHSRKAGHSFIKDPDLGDSPSPVLATASSNFLAKTGDTCVQNNLQSSQPAALDHSQTTVDESKYQIETKDILITCNNNSLSAATLEKL